MADVAGWGDVVDAGLPDPAGRILHVDFRDATGDGYAVMRLRFRYRDLRGDDRAGTGRIYVPAAADPRGRHAAMYVAGYPLEEVHAIGQVSRGYVLVTTDLPEEGTAWPGSHPLMRGPTLDTALLHITRSLPFVDPRRLGITGGSAGGWLTLLLAAETFPLASAMPDVPLVNWAYNAAYFWFNNRLRREVSGDLRPMPVFADFCTVLDVCARALGTDTAAETWSSLSPVNHLDTITCPVSAVFTTADIMVPIEQVDPSFARPWDPADFHPGYTRDAAQFSHARSIHRKLVESLPPERLTVHWIAVPEDATRLDLATPPPEEQWSRLAIPRAETQWNIGVIDEGPTDPRVAHYKYALHVGRDDLPGQYLRADADIAQLTEQKLARLMDRYRGEEWLPCGLVRLDYPEAERADVMRGLAEYCRLAGGGERLASLYAALAPERRVLGEDLAGFDPGEMRRG